MVTRTLKEAVRIGLRKKPGAEGEGRHAKEKEPPQTPGPGVTIAKSRQCLLRSPQRRGSRKRKSKKKKERYISKQIQKKKAGGKGVLLPRKKERHGTGSYARGSGRKSGGGKSTTTLPPEKTALSLTSRGGRWAKKTGIGGETRAAEGASHKNDTEEVNSTSSAVPFP